MKRLLLVTALLAIAFSASADIVLNAGSSSVLPAQSRQGVFISPNVHLPTGTLLIDLSATGIPTVDYENTSNSLSVWVQWCTNGVCASDTDFVNFCGVTWAGGDKVGKDGTVNPPPQTACGVGGADTSIVYRSIVTIPNPMTIGATISITP